MATRQNRKCANFISLRPVMGAWASDFLIQTNLKNHKVWVFPPKVLTLVVFQTLERIVRKNFWFLIVVDYETLGPIWSEVAHDSRFKIIEDLGNNPVLFLQKQNQILVTEKSQSRPTFLQYFIFPKV